MTSNASKASDINNARLALGEKIAILHDRNQRKILAIQILFREDLNTCKNCKNGTMVTIQLTQNKDTPNQIVSCISLK